MGKYRARLSESSGKIPKTNEDYHVRKLLARKHKSDRQFNMFIVNGDNIQYDKLNSMSVVDYLEKVDKFTAEKEIELRSYRRLKSKSNGK